MAIAWKIMERGFYIDSVFAWKLVNFVINNQQSEEMNCMDWTVKFFGWIQCQLEVKDKVRRCICVVIVWDNVVLTFLKIPDLCSFLG